MANLMGDELDPVDDSTLQTEDPGMTAPPPPDLKPDPSSRFKQYLEAQMAQSQRRQSPEYLNARDEHQDRMAGMKDQANLGALLFDSAGKFGSVAGKATPSSYGDFAKGMDNNIDSSMARDASNQREDDTNTAKQNQLYQYLALQQNKEQALKNQMFNAETKRKALSQPNLQGSPIQDPITGEYRMYDKNSGQMVTVGKGGLKPEATALKESEKIGDNGEALVFNSKTGKYEAAEGANGVGVLAKPKAPKEPTADQYKAAGFGKRMEQAEDVFGKLSASGYNRADNAEGAKASLLPGFMQGENPRRQEQAERNFINAVLRRESGAAISPNEFESGEKQYFPRPGDTTNVLAQKKANRDQTIATMKAESAEAYDKVPTINVPDAVTKDSDTATAAPGGGGKQVVKKQYSPSRNQTKVTYSDGTTEVLNGR